MWTRGVELTEWLRAAGPAAGQCLLSTASPGALQTKAGLATSLQSRQGDTTEANTFNLFSTNISHASSSSPSFHPVVSIWSRSPTHSFSPAWKALLLL